MLGFQIMTTSEQFAEEVRFCVAQRFTAAVRLHFDQGASAPEG
jgi:hypothetical protein